MSERPDAPTTASRTLSTYRGSAAMLRREVPVTLKDVSLSGCLVEIPAALSGRTGELRLQVMGRNYCDRVRLVHRRDLDPAARSLLAVEFAWANPPGTCSLRGAVPELARQASRPVVWPELRTGELVLWRLRGEGHELWCALKQSASGLHLSVRDHDTGHEIIDETYPDLEALVRRAEQMQYQSLAAGWMPAD